MEITPKADGRVTIEILESFCRFIFYISDEAVQDKSSHLFNDSFKTGRERQQQTDISEIHIDDESLFRQHYDHKARQYTLVDEVQIKVKQTIITHKSCPWSL
jgi:hypothetical protein